MLTIQDPHFDQLLGEMSVSWKGLPDKPEENPENTLRALWYSAAGDPRPVQKVDSAPLPSLDPDARACLREMIELRASGVPLAYLTQCHSFMGIQLWCGPEAMIPRQVTEMLGHAALERAKRLADERGSALVVDLCTGSGNLALALAYYEPRCTVVGADISPEAVELAKRNAERLEISERVQFVQSDLFEAFESPQFIGQVDLITCNPPYLSTACVETMAVEIKRFEPRVAFEGGPLGVNVLNRLVHDAPRFLKADSWLAFEIGPDQGGAMMRACDTAHGYERVEAFRDGDGVVRAVLAKTGSR